MPRLGGRPALAIPDAMELPTSKSFWRRAFHALRIRPTSCTLILNDAACQPLRTASWTAILVGVMTWEWGEEPEIKYADGTEVWDVRIIGVPFRLMAWLSDHYQSYGHGATIEEIAQGLDISTSDAYVAVQANAPKIEEDPEECFVPARSWLIDQTIAPETPAS